MISINLEGSGCGLSRYHSITCLENCGENTKKPLRTASVPAKIRVKVVLALKHNAMKMRGEVYRSTFS
jgi:hypothetical protein